MPSIRWGLAGLSLSLLLSSLGTSIANVALPTLTKSFDAKFHEVQWVVLAYLLAITLSIVTAGRLGDLLGRRRVLRAGLIVFTGASVACGAAPVLWVLIAARAAQGLGAAVIMALTIAFVTELGPKAKTGSSMGLLGTTSAIGTALGPSLGGALIDGFGWRALFLINVPLGALAVLLVHRYLPRDRSAPPAKADGFGLIRLTMFREPALSARLAANLLVSTVLMATLVVGPFYLSLTLGLDAGRVGLVMSLGPVVAALVGMPAGRLVDRSGTHHTSVLGLAGITLGALALALTPETFGIPGYVLPTVVVTAGYALFQAANNTAVMRDAGPNQRGLISGTLNLSRNLGLITGTAVMGAVFALGSATSDIASAPPEAVAAGMRLTFAVAAALIVVALVLVMWVTRRWSGVAVTT